MTQPVETNINAPDQSGVSPTKKLRLFQMVLVEADGTIQTVNVEGQIYVDPITLQPRRVLSYDQGSQIIAQLERLNDNIERLLHQGE